MPQDTLFNPDEFLTSTVRALKEYIDENTPPEFEVRFQFTEADHVADLLPLSNTIIYFRIDDIDSRLLGFGDSIVAEVITGPPGTQDVEEHEATWHEINFDMGMYASDDNGGVSIVLVGFEYLSNLFTGVAARRRVLSETDGVEILSFKGGQFITQEMDDQPIHRMIGGELVARVFGRQKLALVPALEEIAQEGTYHISDSITIVES